MQVIFTEKISHARDGFFYLTLTLMVDTYNSINNASSHWFVRKDKARQDKIISKNPNRNLPFTGVKEKKEHDK